MMPFTRASSQTPIASSSSTPIGTPTKTHFAPSSSRSARSARATSSTPQRTTPNDGHPHHMTADERTLLEAEKILSTPPVRILRSDGPAATPGSAASARDRRHARLNEAREKGEHHEDDDGSVTTTLESDQHGVESTDHEESEVGMDRKDVILGERLDESEEEEEEAESEQAQGEEDHDDESAAPAQRGGSVSHEISSAQPTKESLSADSPSMDSYSDVIVVAPREGTAVTGQVGEEILNNEAMAEASSSGTSSSESEDHSDSEEEESDSASDSDTSEEGSDEEEEKLERLLQAAKISAMAKQAPTNTTTSGQQGGDDEAVLQFDGEGKKAAPIPDLQIPTLPIPHLAFTADGSAKAAPSTSVLPSRSHSIKKSVKGKEKAVAPELETDDRPYERELSKREKAAQPRKATASEVWATLPSARADALPQMKRDYQALALANSLDPKRFMKGGNKANKVPERFAIGTMVEQSKTLRDTTLVKDTQYRPGQVVQNLVRDQGLGGTAKRKYEDLQHKRMENGRGKGWKKRTKW